ncbi:MAG: hypothetical protein IIA64_09845 [Planctomycetes bacterium]|nr:hypothetical protein [Planctomycetota bacterium]
MVSNRETTIAVDVNPYLIKPGFPIKIETGITLLFLRLVAILLDVIEDLFVSFQVLKNLFLGAILFLASGLAAGKEFHLQDFVLTCVLNGFPICEHLIYRSETCPGAVGTGHERLFVNVPFTIPNGPVLWRRSAGQSMGDGGRTDKHQLQKGSRRQEFQLYTEAKS